MAAAPSAAQGKAPACACGRSFQAAAAGAEARATGRRTGCFPAGCPAGCAAPDCSAAELDILEMVDGDGGAHATYHSQPNCSVSPHDLHDGGSLLVSNFSDVWHEYAVEFSPQKAAFFVDGQVVLDVPKCAPGAPPDSKCGVFFDAPYHLLLNTAIGGPWPQPPDEGTAFPGYHRVDWVRVSSKQRPR